MSLENIITDVCELERGMEAARREAEARGAAHVLRDFVANAVDKLRRLRAEAKLAQVREGAVVGERSYGAERISSVRGVLVEE